MLVGSCGARSGRSFSAPAGSGSPAGRSRRRPFRCRRIRARQAPTADLESVPEAFTQAPFVRSHDRRLVCALDPPESADPFRDRPQTVNALAPSSSANDAEISLALLDQGANEAGTEGTQPGMVAAVVGMKRRNPTWGCPRIAQQIVLAFGIPINKDVVRRILARQYRPRPDSDGPSWLTSLLMRKTVCGVSICFDANRPSCAHTGCSS